MAAAILRNDPNCVFLDHCFERLAQDSERVVATFTNGKTLTSDVLIGCDGAASKVRACVFGGGVVNYTGQVAFRALLVPADEMRFFSLAIDILPPPPVTCDAA